MPKPFATALILALVVLALAPGAGRGQAAPAATAPVPAAAPAPAPIRIGEINSYTTIPQFILPFRQGWQLAVEQINAAGGVRGAPLEVISRDDAGRPDEAVRQAADLVTKERVQLLMGTFVSTTALAVSGYAARSKTVFVAAAPLTDALVWERGNRYTFRIRPSTSMQAAALVEEALRLPGRSWYVIAPNYEYGQSLVATFKSLLKARRPEVVFVGEQWPAMARLDAAGAAAIVRAAGEARPDVIFNALFGADLVQLLREGRRQGLFPRVPVVSALTGEPEYLDIIKDDLVPGWIASGYPAPGPDTPAHQAFVAAYQQRWGDLPRYAALLGYVTMQGLAEGLRQASAPRADDLVRALRGLRFETPVGPVQLRRQDHQATLGVFVGRLELRPEGTRPRGWLGAARYIDGASLQPADAVVRTRRPESANQ